MSGTFTLPLPERTLINVNVPAGEPTGVEVTSLKNAGSARLHEFEQGKTVAVSGNGMQVIQFGIFEADLRTAGVNDFIFAGADALATLRAAHDILDRRQN